MMNPHLNLLSEFLRIPSVSTQPEFIPDMEKAREFLVRLFNSLGLETRLIPSAVHPAVFAQTPHQTELPTILIYGHYDVQPPGAPSQWISPPWEPTVRKDRIYARGSSDNKGQLLIHILSAQELINKFGLHKLPLNIKFYIEGEEEIGSPGIKKVFSDNLDLLSADYLIISDTEMLAPNQPAIDISLRGVMDLEIEIQTASHDVHSGQFGGLAPNPAFILSQLLSGMKNGHDKITLPGFYQDVKGLSANEREDFYRLEPSPDDLLKEGHLYYLSAAEPGITLNQRRWSEPTLDITGLESGYTGQGSKTIIPHDASAKISIRLVPNQNPEKIYQQIVTYFQKNTPKRCCLRIILYPSVPPYKAPTSHPIYSLAKQILKNVFGNPTVFTGQGGSIGSVPVITQFFNIPCLLIGFGLPDDNVHAPNEHLSLENFSKGISAMTLLYAQIPTLTR